jgi:hypothetical protein
MPLFAILLAVVLTAASPARATNYHAEILAEAVWQFNGASGGCRYLESVSGARLQAAGL